VLIGREVDKPLALMGAIVMIVSRAVPYTKAHLGHRMTVSSFCSMMCSWGEVQRRYRGLAIHSPRGPGNGLLIMCSFLTMTAWVGVSGQRDDDHLVAPLPSRDADY
jgi:hypothetical protein